MPDVRPICAIRIFSISASCNRLALARLFWNQIFTCVSVRRSDDENSARSAMLKYCFSRNFFSSDRSCACSEQWKDESRNLEKLKSFWGAISMRNSLEKFSLPLWMVFVAFGSACVSVNYIWFEVLRYHLRKTKENKFSQDFSTNALISMDKHAKQNIKSKRFSWNNEDKTSCTSCPNTDARHKSMDAMQSWRPFSYNTNFHSTNFFVNYHLFEWVPTLELPPKYKTRKPERT